jgi:GNAT superfamily N-acetyltransferase
VESLDRYLRQQASQDVRRGYAAAYVAVHAESGSIHGYYTLSMAGVVLEDVPLEIRSRLPRYPSVPAIRLGRLAVATPARGLGLGEFLLVDAMARALRNEVAWAAFLVDAKDAAARAFYLRYGFLSLADDPDHLFLPRTTIEAACKP